MSTTGAITTTSHWDAVTRILHTELSGNVTTDNVALWREGLYRELARIADDSQFRLLSSVYGYEPADIAAHKAMRTIVPEILATHGLRPAYLDLWEDQPEVEITRERGIECIAFANVHHDPAKINRFEEKIAKPNQRFFTDPDVAYEWILRFV